VDLSFLQELEAIIDSRAREAGSDSYTATLLSAGPQRIAQKVGEEGVELAIAAVAGERDEIINEAADLVYHLLVLLRSHELTLDDLVTTLQARHTG